MAELVKDLVLVSLGMGIGVVLESMKKSAFLTFKEFLNEVNHTLMNDFISMPDDEINRYMKMEKLLENKISRRFKFRRLDKNDMKDLSPLLRQTQEKCRKSSVLSLPTRYISSRPRHNLSRNVRWLQNLMNLYHRNTEQGLTVWS